MIPKEQADLADALQEHEPAMTRDHAVSIAGKLLESFKRKGWKIVEVVG